MPFVEYYSLVMGAVLGLMATNAGERAFPSMKPLAAILAATLVSLCVLAVLAQKTGMHEALPYIGTLVTSTIAGAAIGVTSRAFRNF